MIETKSLELEKVVLVGIIRDQQSPERQNEFLDELAFLSLTAGGEVVGRFTQKMASPDPKTFLGSGKIEMLRVFVKDKDVGTVIFDDELSPAQLRNIERLLLCKILDRTGLILDIFAQRARTSYARTQVELAQYRYLLPRLTGLWTHLERQRGGIGMRGPGETEIETDRRIVRDRISLLKTKLAKIDRQMETQRGNRGNLVRVALVGYTNVGKSTLMNLISKSRVFAENKLFATLDTTVRKVVIRNLPFLMSDTVGFIRKLPTQLIESFKSTLDEVREADLLLHVVDISHPHFEEQMSTVLETLNDIDCGDKPIITIFNKIDLYKTENLDDNIEDTQATGKLSLAEWKKTWMHQPKGEALFISALHKEHLEDFRNSLYNQVRKIHLSRYPYNHFLYPEIDNKQE